MKKKDNLHIKESGFKVPTGYFNSFDDRIHNTLKSKPLDKLKGTNAFTTPNNYFESIESRVYKELNSKPTGKLHPLFNWRYAAFIGGIAASILLIFQITFDSSSVTNFSDLQTNAIESYLLEENLNSYELAQALEIEEISPINPNKNNLSDKAIELYILENTTIEELIIE